MNSNSDSGNNLTGNQNTEKHGITLSNFKTQPLHWLWQQRILRGNLTILEGDPGLGKSLLALDLAARITAGKPMPDDTPCSQGSVILIAPEDAVANTVKPRIEAAGGDPSRICLLTYFKKTNSRTGEISFSPFTLPEHRHILNQTIEQTHAILVIIDPFVAVLAPGINVFRDQNIRQVHNPLALVAQYTDCAFLLIRHLNKGSLGNPLYRGSGSIGIIATARAGLLVTPDPYDENKRILAPIKNNLSAPADNLIYQVIANAHGIPSIQWLGTSHLSVPSLLRTSTALSAERQEILKALQESSLPLGPKQLAEQTGQQYTLVRQLLRRMLDAGEILSPAYGLYTLYHHPLTTSPPSENDSVTPATPTTPATLTTVSHTDSNFDPLPDTSTSPDPTNRAPSTPQISIETTIEQLRLLLHCSYTAHYLLWIFTPQKIGCPICDIWSTRDAATNPVKLALCAAISQYPPHESPSITAWIVLIAPLLQGL